MTTHERLLAMSDSVKEYCERRALVLVTAEAHAMVCGRYESAQHYIDTEIARGITGERERLLALAERWETTARSYESDSRYVTGFNDARLACAREFREALAQESAPPATSPREPPALPEGYACDGDEVWTPTTRPAALASKSAYVDRGMLHVYNRDTDRTCSIDVDAVRALLHEAPK